MDAELTNGRIWHLVIDSHKGDAFRQALIDEVAGKTITIEIDDYRDATKSAISMVHGYWRQIVSRTSKSPSSLRNWLPAFSVSARRLA